MKKKFMAVLMIAAAIGICGCGRTEKTEETIPVEDLEKLGDIRVVSREEGSGTRTAFAALLDFEGDGSSTKTADLTRKDAVCKDNAEDIVEEVAGNCSAIGYVSLGALEDSEEKVKVLHINHAGAGEKDKKYPLRRSFYLAYNGTLNETETDFLTYVHSAGQEIVAKSYTPVAKSSTFLSNKPEGSITIDGSTSAAPLLKELAEEYVQKNPNATIKVTESDSTKGLNHAMSGECDLGMSSRDLKDYEAELLNYEMIAEDEIAVIVNKENPLENISSETLKDIYTGSIKTWSEIYKNI